MRPPRQHVVGVVAHESRREHAEALADVTDAVHIGWDNGQYGAGENHRRVWNVLLRHHAEWAIALEDDCLPIVDFVRHAHDALDHSPAPIVSLYLGKQRPPQHQLRVAAAIDKAEANNAAWIVSDRHLLHHVAVAIRRELLPDMLLSMKHYLPPDEAVAQWARKAGHHIAYTAKSLVDHNDDLPTLATHRDNQPRTPGRTAWQLGVPDNWDSGTVTL